MEKRADATWLQRAEVEWAAVALVVVLFAITNLPWHLDNYDQAKQAFTSFEMVEGGAWFYQHTPGGKVATKPPLVGWVSAALFAVTRSWEVAWRLPPFAAAVALLILLARAGASAYGATAGFLALCAFGLNLLSARLATLVRTDMALALGVFLIGLLFWRKIREQPWTTRDRALLFALLTATLLIKGPIVYAFILPGLVALLWLRRGRGLEIWSGWWPWLGSLAVFALWVAGGIAWMPGFCEEVVLKEFAGRFGGTTHRAQPFYFYLPHLLHKFAPWSVLMLVLAWLGWRQRSGRIAPDMLWLICWSVGGLILMSLIPSKRVDRIFPIVPPLCLLLAAQIVTQRTNARVLRWCALALAIACVMTSAYATGRIVAASRRDDAASVRFGENVRAKAAAHEWRLAVIPGREEGILLYLRQLRFATVEEAIADWQSGRLDALVVPVTEEIRLTQRLPDAEAIEFGDAVQTNPRERRYRLLRRVRLPAR